MRTTFTWPLRLLAAYYLLLAFGVGGFVGSQIADSRRQEDVLGPSTVFGNELPQGETVLPTGDRYVRQGNLVTLHHRDGGEPLGWYVGDDPRAMGGGIGTGPGRVSWERIVAASLAVISFLTIAGCLIVRRPSTWRMAQAAQAGVATLALFAGVVSLPATVWALSQGDLGGGIGLVLAPLTVGIPFVVAAVALYGRRLLHRRDIRESYGIQEPRKVA